LSAVSVSYRKDDADWAKRFMAMETEGMPKEDPIGLCQRRCGVLACSMRMCRIAI